MVTKDKITYKQKMTGNELFGYVKAVAFPFFTLLLALFVINNLSGFGTKLVAPLTAVMWCYGIFCSILLPSHRSSIMNETFITLGSYLIALITFKACISLLSGVSSETLTEALNLSVSATSGSAMTGWMQTLIYITAIMTPVGFIGMQSKRLYSFKRKNSKEKSIERIRGLKDE